VKWISKHVFKAKPLRSRKMEISKAIAWGSMHLDKAFMQLQIGIKASTRRTGAPSTRTTWMWQGTVSFLTRLQKRASNSLPRSKKSTLLSFQSPLRSCKTSACISSMTLETK